MENKTFKQVVSGLDRFETQYLPASQSDCPLLSPWLDYVQIQKRFTVPGSDLHQSSPVHYIVTGYIIDKDTGIPKACFKDSWLTRISEILDVIPSFFVNDETAYKENF